LREVLLIKGVKAPCSKVGDDFVLQLCESSKAAACIRSNSNERLLLNGSLVMNPPVQGSSHPANRCLILSVLSSQFTCKFTNNSR
jgi:hypothetical protein